MLELRNENFSDLFHNGDAIFALATVPGKSAIAVFRCSGPKIWQCLHSHFSRYVALEQAASHSAVHGLLEAGSEIIDEVLLLKFCSPRSYTGEDMLEIHCHGSSAVLECIRRLLLDLGMREAQRGEFSYRSIRYGKRNLRQAEALALLGESQTQNQRRIALLNFKANYYEEQKLRELRHELLQVLARTELQLDYDESELDFHYLLPESLPLAQKALSYLCECLNTFQLQQRHWQPSKVVLAGATNSGKSSLFNRLLASERSIVSERAGTTRNYLTAQLELEGHALELFDTAGLRDESQDPIEQEGIQRTWQLLEQADFLVLVRDVRDAQSEGTEKQKLLELASSRQIPLLEIWNKCDLLSQSEDLKTVLEKNPQNQEALPNYELFLCSALSGFGLPEFIEALKKLLPKFHGTASINERQAECLHEAYTLLEEYCVGENLALDWASELLRQICGRLGEATGEVCNAEMLRKIFEQFCVGK